MMNDFPASGVGIASSAILAFLTVSIATPMASAAETSVLAGKPVTIMGLRIKTDDYLVPAHVCPDIDAERYEDCVPLSYLNGKVVVVLPGEK